MGDHPVVLLDLGARYLEETLPGCKYDDDEKTVSLGSRSQEVMATNATARRVTYRRHSTIADGDRRTREGH